MKLFKFTGSRDGRPHIPRGEEEYPLLPLKDLVVFPQTMMPVFVTYREGVNAVEEALAKDRRLFAVCVKNAKTGEIFNTGTVARVVQHLRLPDSTFRLVLQGEYRAVLKTPWNAAMAPIVRVDPIKADLRPYLKDESQDRAKAGAITPEISAMVRAVQKSFAQYAESSKKISVEVLTAVDKTDSPEHLSNLVGHALQIKSEKKAELLSFADPRDRLTATLENIELENEILGIQKNISGKVKSRIDKNHRNFILQEQLKEINKELGKEESPDEYSELEKTILEKKAPEEVFLKMRKEMARLRKLQPFSPEAGVLRSYLEWIADLPWSNCSEDLRDLAAAEKILDEDHYGMKMAKERIIEFIAVKQLTSGESGIKGPILCFTGPPGTGKTSLGKSVARSLGRKFVRISLGGVRDEAEIRGHRKTYVGALPGKIIQSMKKAQVLNPVFLLDEIDKLAHDFRGDPASALLEVLDPEQNSSFTDHYLEVPYDLSKVLFITTANSIHAIPYPLLDRMEIIEIPGYGENEKLAIAKNFLVPKELIENGLSKAKVDFKDEAIKDIIRHWTMESGVRNLEREIARCARRIARDAVNKKYGKSAKKPLGSYKKTVKKEGLEKLLGRKKYKNDLVFKEARVGVSSGLAWTETGGAMLPVESIGFDGTGTVIITGNLGDVMKESARIALSYLRSAKDTYRFPSRSFGKTDFHIHVPEGAIPKDGPSAGITLAASLLSTLCHVPPKPGIAMTGELTLTGRILPIGGLKEKLLAAIRNGMEKVLLPSGNRDDWEELDSEIKNAISPEFAENAAEAFAKLFDKKILKPGKKAKSKDLKI
jgi:ATP-dependent Lon protease